MNGVAYSFLRFSSPKQQEGDSERRQTAGALSWANRHGVVLDLSARLKHVGSAFTGEHRKNPDRDALARFLSLVESGKVARGSYLIIENLDRLTREDIQPALLLVLNLLQDGVKIVQLSPTELVFDDKSDTLAIMMMIVELSRGHSESKMKSERLGKAWAEKKKLARDKGVTMTSQLPAWIKDVNGERRLIPERAEIVRRIYELCIDGHGIMSIALLFERENVPTFDDAEGWSKSYIARILRERRAVGEMQPCRLVNGNRYVKDGPPMPNYFPAVVSEEEWQMAQNAMDKRQKVRGRIGGYVNSFAGLLHDSITGDKYQASDVGNVKDGKRRSMYRCDSGGRTGKRSGPSFPFLLFELATLEALQEVSADEIKGKSRKRSAADKTREERDRKAAKLAKIKSALKDGDDDIPELVETFRELAAEVNELSARLKEEEEGEASPPIEETVSEAHARIEAIEGASNKQAARIRLRAILRRLLEGIWIVIVPIPKTKYRVFVAQMRFIGSEETRVYSWYYRPARQNGKMAEKKPAIFEELKIKKPRQSHPIDLRNPEDGRRMGEEAVEAVIAIEGLRC